jgi:hypothetical protein
MYRNVHNRSDEGKVHLQQTIQIDKIINCGIHSIHTKQQYKAVGNE